MHTILRACLAVIALAGSGAWLAPSSSSNGARFSCTGSLSELRYVAGVVIQPSEHSVSVEAGFFQKGLLVRPTDIRGVL